MRNINLRYVDEAYDENGLLTKFDITMPDDFNFAYDVVDDIAINDPERTAMVWCNPEGEEHVFTFADMKTWSDKTANFLRTAASGAATSSWSSCAATTSSGSRCWPWRNWGRWRYRPPSC